MRLTSFILFFFILNSGLSFGQLPSSTKKLEGAWKFKEGSGYEVWEIENGVLVGHAFRITKTGDTSKVEDIVLKTIHNRLSYGLTVFNVVNDTLVTTESSFIGGKRKMEFINIKEDVPYSIKYKFGIFSRNKLKVFVKNRIGDDPMKFTLYRVKE